MKKGKFILLLVLVVLLIVGFVGYSYYPLVRVANDLASRSDCDFTANYHVVLNEATDNKVLELITTGKVSGMLRAQNIHGYFYLEGEQNPISEFYMNSDEIKFNLKQTYDYMVQRLDDKTSLSIAALMNLMEECYISGEQMKEIIGLQETQKLPKIEGGWSTILQIHAKEMPENSYFSSEIQDMKFYEYQSENEEPILLGVEKKKADKPKVYLAFEMQGKSIEVVLEYEKKEDNQVIKMPEGEISDETIEMVKWLYERIQEWTSRESVNSEQ